MFDRLIASKFSAKCKQAIKNTVDRVVAIRKKKLAMINLLKKDVADLLAQGHENHAFSRMDKIVNDGNHIRCYDLIADFCECIAAHLPVMHKLKRECPPECVEAVATLTFAAARFSDLPELCILRRLFTERYGCAMESSVNPEFIEKVSKHTLSKNGKLKLMQDIALQYGVDWNSNNFGSTNTPAPASVQRKQDDSRDDRKEHKPVDGAKHPATANNVSEQNAFPRHRLEVDLNSGNAGSKGRGLQPKQDVSVSNRNDHKPVDGLKHAGSTKNVEGQSVLARQRAETRGGSDAVSRDRDLQPVAKDIHVVGGSNSFFYPDAKVVPTQVKGGVHSSSTPPNYRKEFSVEGCQRDAQLGYDSKNNTGGVATREIEKVNPTSGFRASNTAPPPYVKARRDLDGASQDKAAAPPELGLDAVLLEKKVPVGLVKADGGNKAPGGTATEEVEMVKPANRYRASNMAPPYVKPRHMRGASWDKAAAPQQGLDSVTTEKKTPVGLVKEDDSDRALKEVHLYMKPSGSKIDDHSNKDISEEAVERAASKKEPNGATSPKPPTPAFFRPPPYLKPSTNAGNPMHFSEVADVPTMREAGARLQARSASEVENHPVPEQYLATAAEKTPKPRSVRRNNRKPPSVVIGDAGQPLPGKQQNDDSRGLHSLEDGILIDEGDTGIISGGRKPRYESKEREGCRLYPDAGDNDGKIRHERRRHNDRQRLHCPEDVGPLNTAHDANRIPPGKYQQTDRRRGPYHSEEEVDEDEKIDWLLMHYSRKGMLDRKHQIKKVASLPHEDSPKAVRVPARSASSLTDEPSPNGRPVRHQLPDYDELAARFNALKRS